MTLLTRLTLVATVSAGGASVAFSAAFTFTTIADPLANQGTYPNGINDAGEIAGTYYTSSNYYGFTDVAGTLTTISDPLATEGTFAQGINNAAQIVGFYQNASGTYGFLDINGTFTTINDPLATYTAAYGINDAGEIVGDASNTSGFLYYQGTFTMINDPLAVRGTRVTGINDAGQIVGVYYDANYQPHGFLDTAGTFTDIDDPLAQSGYYGGTYVEGINDSDQIVGFYSAGPNVFGTVNGFLDSGGTFTTVNDPLGVMGSNIDGINDAGQIVGTYGTTSSTSGTYGFLGTPAPETSTLTMTAIAAFLAIAGVAWRPGARRARMIRIVIRSVWNLLPRRRSNLPRARAASVA
jgi:probable HAF family extracellular repeat protein